MKVAGKLGGRLAENFEHKYVMARKEMIRQRKREKVKQRYVMDPD